MIILRQKEFGFKEIASSGLKGAAFGAQGGLLLAAPFALLARIRTSFALHLKHQDY
jgi:hypothetical protein